MSSFAAAYILVLLSLVVYLARLGVVQRRLARELESLRGRVACPPGDDEQLPRAA